MAVSTGLRNKLVGFVIVASTILIFLPLLLSKDMIKKNAPVDNAVAISADGAIRDANGNLVPQAPATFEQAVNPRGQDGELLASNNVPYGSSMPELNSNLGSHANADLDNGVEMLEFSGPQGGATLSGSNANGLTAAAGANRHPQPEILGGAGSASKQPSKQPEILVAQNNNKPETTTNKASDKSTAKNNAKDEKPAAKPTKKEEPKATASTKNDKKPEAKSEPGTKVIAGSRPNANFVIQVGVFAKRDNADGVVAKIKKAGISVYAIEVKSNSKTLYRVYAGHANSRSALSKQVAQIDKLCNTKSKVVAL